MPDSNFIAVPGPGLNAADPIKMAAWKDSLPPTEAGKRAIGAFLIRTRGGSTANFRVTRAALEKLEGSADPSTAMIAQRRFAEIEEQCRALYARTAAQPITGWVLDVADLT